MEFIAIDSAKDDQDSLFDERHLFLRSYYYIEYIVFLSHYSSCSHAIIHNNWHISKIIGDKFKQFVCKNVTFDHRQSVCALYILVYSYIDKSRTAEIHSEWRKLPFISFFISFFHSTIYFLMKYIHLYGCMWWHGAVLSFVHNINIYDQWPRYQR